jgi:hypothetical protein
MCGGRLKDVPKQRQTPSTAVGNPMAATTAPNATPCGTEANDGRRIKVQSEAFVRMQSAFYSDNMVASTNGTPGGGMAGNPSPGNGSGTGGAPRHVSENKNSFSPSQAWVRASERELCWCEPRRAAARHGLDGAAAFIGIAGIGLGARRCGAHHAPATKRRRHQNHLSHGARLLQKPKRPKTRGQPKTTASSWKTFVKTPWFTATNSPKV